MEDVLIDICESVMKDLGVEVVDFCMKKINLFDEISEFIYCCMCVECELVVCKYCF